MITGNVVVWEIQHKKADLDCSRIPDFVGDLEDSKSTSGESFASSEVERSFPSVVGV